MPPNEALRRDLEAQAARHGPETLHRRLETVDPVAATRTHPNNLRRVIRSLEVWHETGQPISRQQGRRPPPWDICQLGLMLERGELHQRADRRLDRMIAAGFVEEVRGLLAAGYSRDLPSMSALGYRELAAHVLDDVPLAEALEATRTATHGFIRRQLTWFRGHDRGIRWIDTVSLQTEALVDTLGLWLTQRD